MSGSVKHVLIEIAGKHPVEQPVVNLRPGRPTMTAEGDARQKRWLGRPLDQVPNRRSLQALCQDMRCHVGIRPGSVRRHRKLGMKVSEAEEIA